MPLGMSGPFPADASRPAPVVLAIVGACALIEAVLTLTGGIDGQGGLRRLALIYGAFWPGLLGGWDPAWPGQRVGMFLTYAFVHGGLLHMVFNMLILLHLARETVARVGASGFVLFFAVSSAGGAAVYGLIGGTEAPMVGASGAVFGLFGATMFWDWQRRRAAGAPVQPVLRMAAGLVAMNVILWVLVQGMLAWQAHLGGFLAGAAAAMLATPTLAHRHRSGRGGFR
jgi:membrane associated rhomboid family serine protease